MWIFLAVLTAVFTSLQEVYTKKITSKVNPYVIAWGWMFFSLPFLAPFLGAESLPRIGPLFIKTLIASTLILTFAAILYVKAIEASDLSLCVPMLTFTPLFLLLTSPMMVGESPGPRGLWGVLMIVVGSYILNIKDFTRGPLKPFQDLIAHQGTRYMLIVAILFSVGANCDKIGVIHSSPIIWLFSLNLAVSVALFFFMIKNVQGIRKEIQSVWPVLLITGFFNGAAILCQMFAIKLTLVPYLIAIKRVSALITSVLGLVIFKEKSGKERLIAALLMVVGVFLIAFS